jgi:hypothetical protein
VPIPDANSAPARILPRYDGRSLLNLPASIAAVLGASTDGLAPTLDPPVLPTALLDGVRAVVLVVVDGLGRLQLDTAIAGGDAPTLAALAADHRSSLATITSVFPSSTIPALTTLNTGLPPAAHALIGWTVLLEEFGEVAELARWGPAAGPGSYQDERLGAHDPAAFFGRETLYQRLGRAGVRSVVANRAAFRGSGLTRMLFQGAEYRGYVSTSSLFPTIERALARREADERLYVYGYWDLLDTVSHYLGLPSVEHREELAVLDFALGRWLGRHQRRGDTLLLLTADHGHVASPADRQLRLDLEPGFLDLLRAPPSGERRLLYLHTRPGSEAALRAYCAERLGEAVETVETVDALERGWFGPEPPTEAARQRAGDLLLLARPGVQLICPLSEHQTSRPYLGNHGALEAEEMLVPLLAVRL